MKLTQEQLNKIIASHDKWLRSKEGGVRANLSGVNLCHANLAGVNLCKADLCEANLFGANLCGANLREANLSDVNLCTADLCEADLREVNLTRANLSRADLSGADLREANLRRAYLGYVNLARVDLREADLREADMHETIFGKRYYEVALIGSRKGATTYCVDDDNVLCGCWNNRKGGTLAEFKQRVENVYGKNGKTPNAKYYGQYMAAIDFFEDMKKLQEELENEN